MKSVKGIFGLCVVIALTFISMNHQIQLTQEYSSPISQSQPTLYMNIPSISLGNNQEIEKYQDIVSEGSGTIDDPYIIENLWIENNSLGNADEILWNDNSTNLTLKLKHCRNFQMIAFERL